MKKECVICGKECGKAFCNEDCREKWKEDNKFVECKDIKGVKWS